MNMMIMETMLAAQRKDELWEAIIKSNKSFEEILKYVCCSSVTVGEVEE